MFTLFSQHLGQFAKPSAADAAVRVPRAADVVVVGAVGRPALGRSPLRHRPLRLLRGVRAHREGMASDRTTGGVRTCHLSRSVDTQG